MVGLRWIGILIQDWGFRVQIVDFRSVLKLRAPEWELLRMRICKNRINTSGSASENSRTAFGLGYGVLLTASSGSGFRVSTSLALHFRLIHSASGLSGLRG